MEIRDEDVIEILESVVFNERAPVSYKWVSKEYGICLNSAKRILGLFADKYRTQPLAVYYQIYGISSDTGYIECKFIEKFDLENERLRYDHCSVSVCGIGLFSSDSEKLQPHELDNLYPDARNPCQDYMHVRPPFGEAQRSPELELHSADYCMEDIGGKFSQLMNRSYADTHSGPEEASVKKHFLLQDQDAGASLAKKTKSEPGPNEAKMQHRPPTRSTPGEKTKLTSFFKPVTPKQS